MTRGRRITGGIVSLSIAKIGGVSIQLMSIAVLSRAISPEQFGVFASYSVVASLALTVFDGALALPLLQRAGITKRRFGYALTSSAIVSAIVIAALLLVAPFYERVMDIRGAAIAVQVGSACLIVRALASVYSAVAQKQGRYALVSTASLGGAAGGAFISIGLAWIKWGAMALVCGAIGAALIEYMILLARSTLRPRINLDSRYFREFFIRGGSFVSVQTLNWVALSAPSLTIGRMLGADALGLYSRSWRILDFINAAASGPLQRVLIPQVAQRNRSPEGAREIVSRALALSWIAFLPVGVCGAIHATAFVFLLLGERWQNAAPILGVLLLSFPARGLYKVCDAEMYGMGKSLEPIFRQSIFSVLTVSAAIIGVRHGGLYGAAVAITLATILYSLMLQIWVLFSGRVIAAQVCGGALYAVTVTAMAAAADLAIMMMTATVPVLLKHALGAAGFAVVLLAAVLLLPPRALGPHLSGRLFDLRARVGRRIVGS